MKTLDHALELERRGLSVIPVPRPVEGAEKGKPGDGKVPLIPWKRYQERRPTEAELRAWFVTEQNLAVITGTVSGVVVVDADSPEAVAWVVRHLPRTPWQTRTSRGIHAWYRHPGIRVHNKARVETRDGRLAIDVRGDGGYVVAPGSVHESGHAYTMAGNWNWPREKLPVFWIGWLARPERHHAPRPPSARPTGDVVTRARAYLSAIPRPEIGQGSDHATLYAACKLVRGFGLNESDAVSLLWEWAGSRPGWSREWVEQKVANALRYGEEPIGGLR